MMGLGVGLALAVLLVLHIDFGSWAVADEEINYSNGKSYSVNIITYSENGKCVKELTLNGPQMSDVFRVGCEDTTSNILINQSSLVYGSPKDAFALFSNSPGSLVILQNGKCMEKTYTETPHGFSPTFSEMSDNECLIIKQKMEEEIEKNRLYWEEWNKNFTQELSNMFPPGFPFHKQPQTAPDKSALPEIEDAAEGSFEWWKNWSQKFNENMQKEFPPGFPFHDQN